MIGCGTANQPLVSNSRSTVNPVARTINLSDGCDEEEGRALAKRYYSRKYGHGMEGGLREIEGSEEEWNFQVIGGYAAKVMASISVSKRTGFIRFEEKN